MNTIQEYIAGNNIEIGAYYSTPFGFTRMVTGTSQTSYGCDCIVFDDGSKHSIEHSWGMVKVDAPKVDAVQVYVDDRKEHDDLYFKTKSRHSELCAKKAKINDQGKNKTMRNAYINQELEGLRHILQQYKA